MRRTFLAQMGAMAAGLAAPNVFAQSGNYPDKPIRVNVSFPTGGTVDPMIRLIQPRLARATGVILLGNQPWRGLFRYARRTLFEKQRTGMLDGQPVIVENRPGGTTSIAAGFVTKQPADGYTLLFTGANTHLIHVIDQPHITYDPVRDFTPIAGVSGSGWVLACHESIPATTVAEYVAYAKANPNKISYASSGVGNANHLAMERFNQATGIKTVHVPYKAGATAALDFMAGRVHAYFTVLSNLSQAIQSGRCRGLAYSATKPGQVPAHLTFAGAGMPEFENAESVNCLMGPANMPAPVVAKLASAVQRALVAPEIPPAFATANQYTAWMSPEQLGTRMRNDFVMYKKIVKDANIKMEL